MTVFFSVHDVEPRPLDKAGVITAIRASHCIAIRLQTRPLKKLC